MMSQGHSHTHTHSERLTVFYFRLCDFIYSSTIFFYWAETHTHTPSQVFEWCPMAVHTLSHTQKNPQNFIWSSMILFLALWFFYWAETHTHTPLQVTKWCPIATHTLTHTQKHTGEFIWGPVILFLALWFFKSWADVFFYSERHKKCWDPDFLLQPSPVCIKHIPPTPQGIWHTLWNHKKWCCRGPTKNAI